MLIWEAKLGGISSRSQLTRRCSLETHALNLNTMTSRLGTLENIFRYTDFASDEIFDVQRKRPLNRYLGVSDSLFGLAPTSARQARIFGSWTINSLLGKGIFARSIAQKILEAFAHGRWSDSQPRSAPAVRFADLCHGSLAAALI